MQTEGIITIMHFSEDSIHRPTSKSDRFSSIIHLLIFSVYANGLSQEAPTRVVIPTKMLNTMDSALKEVNSKVHLTASAVRR